MEKIGVVIADDHPIVRKAVIDSFRNNSRIHFLGEANDGTELFDLIRLQVPHIAIIDLEMPGMSGYETLLELHRQYPEIKTIVFTGFLDPTSQQRAINMGARATVSKTDPPKVLVSAIESVIDGKEYHTQMPDSGSDPQGKNRAGNLLTLREKQILNLIAEGKTSKQIAQACNISQWTVNKHRSNIKEKLKIKSLAEIIRFAIGQPEGE